MAITAKTKIIHLVTDLNIGGAQKVVLDICSSADLEKYDLSIYSLGDGTDLLSTYDLDSRIKIRTFAYDFEDAFSFWAYLKRGLRPSVSFDHFRSLIDAVVTERPDILHLHLGARELNLGLLIQAKTGCELVYTQHLTNLARNSFGTTLLGIIFRLTYRKYWLIAVSRTIEEEIRKHSLVGRDRKLYLVENKLNLSHFVPAPKQHRDYICVVYVARMSPVKAHHDLIRAWSLLKDEPTPKKLLLVGPDGMNNEMQLLAESLGVADTIEFVGPCDRVVELLNEADLAVFPSHQEGLPIALLEKMAMKLPVLVSDIPELTTIITDNVNGFVFRCGDRNELAAKLATLIRDPNLRKRFGDKARETIEEHFGTTNIARPNELVYEEIVAGKASEEGPLRSIRV